MKLVQFKMLTPLGEMKRIGILLENKILDLYSGYVAYLVQETKETKPYEMADLRISNNMLSFLDGGEYSMEAARRTQEYFQNLMKRNEGLVGPKKESLVLSRDLATIIEPITYPRYIVDFMTFETHYRQSLEKLTDYSLWKKYPIGYKKNPNSIIGPTDPIIFPKIITKWLDFEVEFGVVIGKKGKDIEEGDANKYIAGFTAFNDISARDIEIPEIFLRLGPFKSKDFDCAGPLGPCIVTPDEIGEPHNLKMELRVNGQVMQQGNTKDMKWSVYQLIAYTSKDQTLLPGTLLFSGNPGRLEDKTIQRKERLKIGDIVEAEIEKIGTLRNEITEKS
ncbi:MAG: fumarylacetoacetate hydrolase family protein [Candidatus Helarchaeota archaeon]|nr:fumarylacetoacetate hydrolase family protein [Candidatus Helarchaeota archaeon]